MSPNVLVGKVGTAAENSIVDDVSIVVAAAAAIVRMSAATITKKSRTKNAGRKHGRHTRLPWNGTFPFSSSGTADTVIAKYAVPLSSKSRPTKHTSVPATDNSKGSKSGCQFFLLSSCCVEQCGAKI